MNDGLLRRDFTDSQPTHKWVSHLTEHPTAEGKIYCCAIKDLVSNRIVGHAVSDRMAANLAVGVLQTALARCEPEGVVIVHTDRGSQFRANSLQAVLRTAGHQVSMRRVSSAGDNASMEFFWAPMQRNVLDTGP